MHFGEDNKFNGYRAVLWLESYICMMGGRQNDVTTEMLYKQTQRTH